MSRLQHALASLSRNALVLFIGHDPDGMLMSDLFDPFLFRRQEHDALDGYRSNTMTIAAKQILLTSRESDEAYLGAIAVLMLNGAV